MSMEIDKAFAETEADENVKEKEVRKEKKKEKPKKEDRGSTSSIKFACRRCKYILSEDEKKCPSCGSSEFSDEWNGIIVILDTSSELAKVIGAKMPGRYAIKVR